MLRIRLTRVGKKNEAHYRVVVADSKKAIKAKFIAIVGWYNPHTKELKLNTDEIKNWIAKGAQPTNTVAKILKKEGFKLPDWVKIIEKKRKPKSKSEEDKSKAVPAEETSIENAEQSAESEVPEIKVEVSAETESSEETKVKEKKA